MFSFDSSALPSTLVRLGGKTLDLVGNYYLCYGLLETLSFSSRMALRIHTEVRDCLTNRQSLGQGIASIVGSVKRVRHIRAFVDRSAEDAELAEDSAVADRRRTEGEEFLHGLVDGSGKVSVVLCMIVAGLGLKSLGQLLQSDRAYTFLREISFGRG